MCRKEPIGSPPPSVWTWMDNSAEDIVRIGGKPSVVVFSPEATEERFTLDPRRSVALPIQATISRADIPAWRIADFLYCLVHQFGVASERPNVADAVAFRTIFPIGTAEALSKLRPTTPRVLGECRDIPRVVNNPHFHSLPNASSARLLNVTEYGGSLYAVDLAAEIPSARAISREIAALHHSDPRTVAEVSARLLPGISDALT